MLAMSICKMWLPRKGYFQCDYMYCYKQVFAMWLPQKRHITLWLINRATMLCSRYTSRLCYVTATQRNIIMCLPHITSLSYHADVRTSFSVDNSANLLKASKHRALTMWTSVNDNSTYWYILESFSHMNIQSCACACTRSAQDRANRRQIKLPMYAQSVNKCERLC